MYTYVNRRTGAVIQTPCPCEGEDWTASAEEPPVRPETKTEAAPAASRKPRARRKDKE